MCNFVFSASSQSGVGGSRQNLTFPHMDIFAGSGFMGAAAIKGSHINHLALDFVKMDIPADIKKPPSYRMVRVTVGEDLISRFLILCDPANSWSLGA